MTPDPTPQDVAYVAKLALAEERARARALFEAIRAGECWCEFELLQYHSSACQAIQAYMAEP